MRTLARVGQLAFHGIGITPGETTAIGFSGPRPVLLLPGRIDAALAGWLTVGRRMLARRAFRLIEEQPFAAELARKIASPLGLAEVVAVRRRLGKVEPVAQGLSVDAGAGARRGLDPHSGRQRGPSGRRARRGEAVAMSNEPSLRPPKASCWPRCARRRGRSSSSKWCPPRRRRKRFEAHLDLTPLPGERVTLAAALGRVLADDLAAPIDVPPFDRANVDGFALRAADSAGAAENAPKQLALNAEVIACGHAPKVEVRPGTATTIATGGVVPRGADAVVMIEHTELIERVPAIELRRAVTPGQFISYAGSDIARGETLMRKGQVIGSREVGMLAACGLAEIDVVRRPKVAVLSTGDELVALGDTLRPGGVYDSNGAILAAAVAEAGGEPVPLRRVRRRRRDAWSRRCAARSPNATWWCCRAAPRRAPATFRIAWCRSSASPAFWSMAWRSSPASRCASPSPTASRSRCCRVSRPRRSSPSTPSSRR